MPRGNACICIFIDSFGRHADKYATTEAELTTSNTADTLVDRYIPPWGCSVTLISNNGLQFCARFSRAVYERLGINKVTTSSNLSCTNDVVERVDYTMTLTRTTKRLDHTSSSRRTRLRQRRHRAGPR